MKFSTQGGMSDQQPQLEAGGAEPVRKTRPRFDYGSGTPQVATQKTINPSLSSSSGAYSIATLVSNPPIALMLLLCAVIGTLLFRYNFSALYSVWNRDPSWSHGFGIPVLAVVLAYMHWDRLKGVKIRPSLVGLAILAFGVASNDLYRVTGQAYLSNLSLVVVLYGMVLFLFGWAVMRMLWLPIGYLTLMINLPTTLYVKITTPLQFIAAELGVTMLPLLGIESRREGTVIKVPGADGIEQSLDVEQACSGIRMLIAFVALAVVLAYSTRRPMWQKIFLTFSSIPVAILCNSFRVTLTGWLYVHAKSYAEGAPHALLGLLMLIPAMGMQLAIGWVLDRIFIEKTAEPAGVPA